MERDIPINQQEIIDKFAQTSTLLKKNLITLVPLEFYECSQYLGDLAPKAAPPLFVPMELAP
ncbi:Zinc finger MYM-type protein 1 [Aphis craccivora]|uniref:Zinc finger MYM-type protein 1 n=1 Tax=Aphis craccivora TaxID=307492 RepID=A0A6G0VLY2_APHCR|nr:Zinc finger MYM-type protein 1 [Aphis craccivora]